MQYRRSDYDVTNTVQVSSVPAVKRAVEELYSQTWPSGKVERLDTAFTDFERLFNGHFPGYLGCDTVYHDLQHSLDDTLAMARLLAGYDRSHAVEQRLGAERAMMGIVVALFHDAGYIRQTDDTMHRNGAEFTRTHVGRSAQFLTRYLPTLGLADWVPVATQIVHFTGYEALRCRAATKASSRSSTVPVSTSCAARRSSSPRPCERGSTASSAAPTATSRRSTAVATRTWRRSTRAWFT